MTAVSRRCLLVVAAASTVASTSSCAKIKNLAKNIGSNPTVQELIGEIAKEVGANVVLKIAKYTASHLDEWRNNIESKVKEWASGGSVSSCDDDHMWTDNPDSPTIIVRELRGSPSSCEANSSNSYCAIFFDAASDVVLLPMWAWMTLREFTKEQYSDKEGADLKRTQALLRMAIRPTSSRTDQHETPGNAVATVSWKTKEGQVDIARIEKDDHTYKGVIKVFGYPDENGLPTVVEMDLSE